MTVTGLALSAAFACAALIGHGLIWIGLVNRVHSWAGPRPIVDLATHICAALFFVLIGAIGWRIVDSSGDAAWAFSLADPRSVYANCCALFGVVMLVVKPLAERRRYDPAVVVDSSSEIYDVAKQTGHALYVSGRTKLLGKAPVNESLSVAVERRTLQIPRLPNSLEGLTFCHLSDLHFTGGIDRAYFEYVVDKVAELAPEVVCVTGDIIENQDCRSWLTGVLGKLSAPLGVHFILGNHDLYIDSPSTVESLVQSGWNYVGGQWLDQQWRATQIRIAGNELPWIHPTENSLLPPPRNDGEFRLVLTHSPDQFAWAMATDADLVLAGHTHGGQVRLPWLGVIASPSVHGARFACGVFKRRNTVMHVSRGISGKNPLRWRCRPEIALLRLTSPQSS